MLFIFLFFCCLLENFLLIVFLLLHAFLWLIILYVHRFTFCLLYNNFFLFCCSRMEKEWKISFLIKKFILFTVLCVCVFVCIVWNILHFISEISSIEKSNKSIESFCYQCLPSRSYHIWTVNKYQRKSCNISTTYKCLLLSRKNKL